MIELRISTEASFTTVSTGCCSAFGFRIFSRNRLKTFSTSMIASSTNAPMAIAIPPKLIVLMVYPSILRTMMDTNSEMGMASNEITVVRQFIKKMNSTITTKKAPSSKV